MGNTQTDFPTTGEITRLEILRKYEILDTPPDDCFDRITQLSAKLFKVPITAVSLVEEDRIWFKSKCGIEESEFPLGCGFCDAAIEADDFYFMEDARADSRARTHPLVTQEPGLRFYAAVPLRTKEGYNLGTLCIMDRQPRRLNKLEKELLKDLADLVMNQIELQLEAKKAMQYHHKVLHSTAHDLKNPVSIMPLLAELIMENKDDPAAIDDISKQIKDAGRRMAQTVNALIDNALEDSNSMHLRLSIIDLYKLVKGVVDANQAPARKKGQEIRLKLSRKCKIYGDHRRITEVIDNIISNAIKFSSAGQVIEVQLVGKDNKAIITVSDNGPGLTKDDLKNLFRRFTSLSSQPTGGENSTGLGLYIAKETVQAHHGRIFAESEGKGTGACFTIELPLAEDQG